MKSRNTGFGRARFRNARSSHFRIARLHSSKRRGRTVLALTWLAAASATGQIQIPETLTFTGTFADIDDFAVMTELDEGPGAATLTSAVVTGIPKFDPALGTLTAIRVSASYDYAASGDFFIDFVSEPDGPYLAEVFSIFHELGLNLRRSNSPGTGIGLINSTQFMPDTYAIFDPEQQDSFSESGSWSFADGEDDIFSSADLTDFVGTGDVTVLEAAIFLPIEGEFFLENVEAVTLETFGGMSDGEVQVSYDYVPIPEPGTTMMAFSGLILGLTRRRRARNAGRPAAAS